MAFIEVQTVSKNILYVNIDKIVYVKLMNTTSDANYYEIILDNGALVRTYDDISVHLGFKISEGKSY